MIKEGQSDTAEPHNLLDDDFDEDMTTLPAARLDIDVTPIMYVIVKNRLSSVLHDLGPDSLNTIVAIHRGFETG